MERQRDDGKMMHELSQRRGLHRRGSRSSRTATTTRTRRRCTSSPRGIISMRAATIRTSSERISGPSLELAFEYCLSADDDGDGLMDNTTRRSRLQRKRALLRSDDFHDGRLSRRSRGRRPPKALEDARVERTRRDASLQSDSAAEGSSPSSAPSSQRCVFLDDASGPDSTSRLIERRRARRQT